MFLSRNACAFGRMGIVVTPSGKVIPCEQLPSVSPFVVGDLKKQSILEVWNSQELMALLYPSKEVFYNTACYTCEDFDNCILKRGWCIRDIYKVYRSINGVQPLCPKSNHNVRLT